MPRMVFATRLPARWKNDEPFDAQIDAEQAAFSRLRPQAAGDEELVHFGATEGDVARRDVAAVVLTDQPAARIAEIEATIGCVERQVVGPTQRLAVALFRGRLKLLPIARQVQHRMLAGIAN